MAIPASRDLTPARPLARPQDTREANPCGCRTDSVQLFDEAATAREVAQEYRLMTH